MELVSDFLQAEPITTARIYPHLKCDEQEAEILRALLKEYLEGESDWNVGIFLLKFFHTNAVQNLAFLPKVRNLIGLGLLNQSGFDFLESKESLLELYAERIRLSGNFFKILEGSLDEELPEISAYSDDLEYLKDQFMRIDLLHKLSNAKSSNAPSLSFSLKLLDEHIKARLKLTLKRIPIVKFLKEYHLTQKEQILFLAVLKEEYSSKDGELFRESGTLLGLISSDEYERMRNSALLNENSKLITEGLLDYDEYISGFGNITRSFFIPQEILQKITHPTKQRNKISLSSLVKNQDIFELLEPKQGLDSVVLHERTRETLNHLLAQVDARVAKLLKQWGIKQKRSIEAKILLYGPPGTGKTLSALALAKSLKKEVLSFDCSKILSMYVGESEKNVRQIFDTYKDICKKTKNEPILLLDEADQFLSSRANVASSADKMHNQMQNIFLEQIERFEGIIIATTNLIENFDSAFSRRFNYKIEFKRPNFSQRQKLWKSLLPRNISFVDSKQVLIDTLSEYDLSGAQIKLVIKNTAYKVATRENPVFSIEDFKEEIKKEQSGNFDGSKNVGFIRR